MISIAFAQGRLCLRHSTMLQCYQNLVLAICVPFMREVKALSSLHICTGSPEPSALDNTISTTTPCAGAKSYLSDTYADSEYAGESHLHSLSLSVNNILFKYKVHRDTTDTSYIQYNTFERDTEISLRLV